MARAVRTSLIVFMIALLGSGCADPSSEGGSSRLEIVRGPDGAVVAGETLVEPIVVRSVDDAGRAVPGLPVTWHAAAGTLEPLGDTTGIDGLATARYRSGLVPGANRITVALGDAPGTVLSVEGQAFRADVVDAGYQAGCALATGDLWCWGNIGPLGATIDGGVARRLDAGLGLTELALADRFACALDAAGTLRCRGEYNEFRRATTLEPVPGMPLLRDITAGDDLVCGIALADSTAWCHSRFLEPPLPLGAWQASSTLRFASVSAGGYRAGSFACGLTAAGEAWCWGGGRAGQLGTGSTASTRTPQRVATTARFASIHAGLDYACGVDGSLAVLCWGSVQPSGPEAPRRSLVFGGVTPSAIAGVRAQALSAGRFPVVLDGTRLLGIARDGRVFEVEDAGAVRPVAISMDEDLCVRSATGHAYCNPAASGRPSSGAGFERLAAVAPPTP